MRIERVITQEVLRTMPGSQLFTYICISILFLLCLGLVSSIHLQVRGKKHVSPIRLLISVSADTYTVDASCLAGHFNGNKTGKNNSTNSSPLTSALNLAGYILSDAASGESDLTLYGQSFRGHERLMHLTMSQHSRNQPGAEERRVVATSWGTVM